MDNVLKQRNFLSTKIFELTDESLIIKISKPLNYAEFQYNFEDISLRITRNKKPNQIILILCIMLFVLISIAIFSHFFDKDGSSWADIMFYCIPLSISLFLLYVTFENEVNVILNNVGYISFYANSPNRSQVDEFLSLMKEKQKKYLLHKYATLDPYLTDEQLANNLKWLRDRNIINESELEHLRSSLLQKYPNATLGFKFNTDNN